MKTPPAPAKKKNPFFTPTGIISVVGIAVILNVAMNYFRPSTPAPAATGVELRAAAKSFPTGQRVDIRITNNTEKAIALEDECPAEPLTVERKEGEAWVPVTAASPSAACPTLPALLQPGASHTVAYSNWNDDLFSKVGRYRVSLAAAEAPAEFDIAERGFFSRIFLLVLYQPMYNALIWLISVLPGMSLGWAIIALTLIIRLILFIPTYRSLSHQAELQALQPELERIKKQHASDKEKQASATMALYKERGVNPCGSCLPLLIQLPVLWAVYYVLRDGVDAANRVLLYPMLQHIDLSKVETAFAGMDLLQPKNVPIAVIGFVLQFLSMKLITWSLPKEVRESQAGSQVATTNMLMTYVLPVFIGYLSYTYPAGLGLYWAMSTLFGIGQQLVLKRARERQTEARAAGSKPGTVKDAEFRETSGS